MAIQSGEDKVVIAVDPHTAVSWTAAAVDSSLQPLASVPVPVSRDGYQALRRFARQWPNASWAIEGAAGLGASLTKRLGEDLDTDLPVVGGEATSRRAAGFAAVRAARRAGCGDVPVGLAKLQRAGSNVCKPPVCLSLVCSTQRPHPPLGAVGLGE